MRTIPTRVHGIADYAFAAATLALVPMHRPSAGTRSLLTGAGLAILGMAMLTRYEYGVWRVLPMRAHLAADAVLDGLFLAAPAMLPKGDRQVAQTMLAMGLLGSALTAMTERESPREWDDDAAGNALGEVPYGDGYGYGDDDVVAIGI